METLLKEYSDGNGEVLNMKYTKNENVKNLEKDWKTDAYKELYEEYLGNLYKWENIDRLDELICLIDSFVGNKEFEKYFNHCEYGLDEVFDEKKNLVVRAAMDTMNIFDHFPLLYILYMLLLLYYKNLILLFYYLPF